MSVKKNIIANYVGQLYVAGVGILILPLYVKFMGAEAYGLIGFFAMLQAWFALLDLGLTPTISRETARYKGGQLSALEYRQLFRALSLIFLSVAVIGGGVLWFLAEPIAKKWLDSNELKIDEVILSVQIMAVAVSMRWMGGLFRGIVTGSEKLVWLSSFNVLITTIKFVGVFISMRLYGFTPEVFFWHQLATATVELVGLFWLGNLLLPRKNKLDTSIGWSFISIKPVLKFSLTIAFTSSIWVLVTQSDKLILSGILPLDEYGLFTLAVMVAAGIMMLSQPVSTVVMPRMARLNAEGKVDEMINTYRSMTQLVSAVAGSASIFIAVFAEHLLFAWTGEPEIATATAPILRLYALGYGVLAVAAFPYYLQYALGNLRYHLIGNLIIVLTLIPAIILAASHFGAIGAGWAWLVVNTIYLLTWVAFVHHKLSPGLHQYWLFRDVLIIYLPVVVFLMFMAQLDVFLEDQNRIMTFLSLLFISGFALLIACFSSNKIRDKVRLEFRKIG